MAGLDDARRAKRRLAAELAGVPGVGPVGLAARGGTDDGLVDYVVKVGLAHAGVADRVPVEVDGVPVVTEVVGPIRPQG